MSTGIATAEPNGVFHLFKAKGQVREAFRTRDMRALLGSIGPQTSESLRKCGLKVDFDSLLRRSGRYKHEEKCRLDSYIEETKNNG